MSDQLARRKPDDGWTAAFVRRLSRVTTSGSFIPEIDGLRFLAIAAVIAWHVDEQILYLAGNDSERLGSSWLAQLTSRGQYGVQLFFSISGFILGLPFARQAIASGARVALDKYFRRRLTRLEPPYLLTLFIYFACKIAFRSDRARDLFPDLLASCFYVNGIVHNAQS